MNPMTGIPSPSDGSATPRVEVDDSGRARVLWLQTDDVRVGVVPALGGRVLSLVTRAGEHLFRNRELLDDAVHPTREIAEIQKASNGALGSWLNWGGDKTWPAPQGWFRPDEWPGPPDAVLDGGPYIASWNVDDRGASVEMRSPHDPRTGLSIRRRVEVTRGKSGYRLTSTYTNTRDRDVRWAIWQVVQLPGARRVAVEATEVGLGVWISTGQDPEVPVEHLIAGTGHLKVDHGCAEVVWVPPQDVVGKVGFPTASGWLAHANDGRLTALRFVPEPGATYPDRGSRVEVWMEHPLSKPLPELGGLRPRNRVVECEVLGPLQTMSPGSSTQLATDVLGCSGEGPVHDVQPGACLLEPLIAVSDRLRLNVTGRLGAFSTGPVTIELLDPSQAILRAIPFGQASAGTSFELGLAVDAPDATTSVVVHFGGSVVASAQVNPQSEWRGRA
jgi:hypothetical protein